jgi:hypothetical protein
MTVITRRRVNLRAGFNRLCVVVAMMLGASRAYAQCDPAAFGAYPNDGAADDWGIQQCLNQGGTTTLVNGFPGYIIANTLNIVIPGTTIIGPSSTRAHLIASSTLAAQMLMAHYIDGFTLSNLRIDGNKDNRDTGLCAQFNSGDDNYGKNMRLIGNGFLLSNIISGSAVCGSGAEVQGSGFEITNSFFANNGYGAEMGGPWADGLTVWGCFGGGSIHDSTFSNNTDIDLIVGGGDTCSIHNNTIFNNSVHAFGGLMVAWFPGDGNGGFGNHNNIQYYNNSISSQGLDLLSFGLMVGTHPWDLNLAKQVTNAGSVFSNTVTGAVANIAVDGISAGLITDNGSTGAQGTWGYPNCSIATNYAAGHFAGATIDSGFLSLVFDLDGPCGVPR